MRTRVSKSNVPATLLLRNWDGRQNCQPLFGGLPPWIEQANLDADADCSEPSDTLPHDACLQVFSFAVSPGSSISSLMPDTKLQTLLVEGVHGIAIWCFGCSLPCLLASLVCLLASLAFCFCFGFGFGFRLRLAFLCTFTRLGLSGLCFAGVLSRNVSRRTRLSSPHVCRLQS